jgi:hypothetical protein
MARHSGHVSEAQDDKITPCSMLLRILVHVWSTERVDHLVPHSGCSGRSLQAGPQQQQQLAQPEQYVATTPVSEA